jgi:replicative DNA helicase
MTDTPNKYDEISLKKIQVHVIAGIARHGQVLLHQVKNILTDDCFSNDQARLYYHIIRDIVDNGFDVDEIQFEAFALYQKHGKYFNNNKEKLLSGLQHILQVKISEKNAVECAKILARRNFKNNISAELLEVKDRIDNLPDNTETEDVVRELVAVLRKSESLHDKTDKIENLGYEIQDYLDELLEGDESQPGLDIGYPLVSQMAGCILPGTVHVIAARMGIGKCLSGDSLIYFEDGSQITLENVVKHRIDKPIITYDENNDRFVSSRIVNYWTTGQKECVAVTTKSGRTVHSTLEHKYLTPDGWKQLQDIVIGEYIAARTNTSINDILNTPRIWDQIVSIERVGVRNTYDLEIATHHNYIADNIITHNSAFLLNIALNVAQQGIPVLYLDTEMSRRQMQTRSLANLSQVNINHIQYKLFRKDQDQVESVVNAADILDELPIVWRQAGSMNYKQQLDFARRWIASNVGFNIKDKANPCLIILDYIKLTGDLGSAIGKKEFEQLGELANATKSFAQEFEVPIFTAAQQNRDALKEGQRGSTGTMSGSDRIAMYVDTVMEYAKKTDTEILEDNADFEGDAGNMLICQAKIRNAEAWHPGDYICLNYNGCLMTLTEVDRKTRFYKPKETKKPVKATKNNNDIEVPG